MARQRETELRRAEELSMVRPQPGGRPPPHSASLCVCRAHAFAGVYPHAEHVLHVQPIPARLFPARHDAGALASVPRAHAPAPLTLLAASATTHTASHACTTTSCGRCAARRARAAARISQGKRLPAGGAPRVRARPAAVSRQRVPGAAGCVGHQGARPRSCALVRARARARPKLRLARLATASAAAAHSAPVHQLCLSDAEHEQYVAATLESAMRVSSDLVRCPNHACGAPIERLQPTSAPDPGAPPAPKCWSAGLPFLGRARSNSGTQAPPQQELGPDGTPLSEQAVAHRDAHRMRCAACGTNFCLTCGAQPYHLGASLSLRAPPRSACPHALPHMQAALVRSSSATCALADAATAMVPSRTAPVRCTLCGVGALMCETDNSPCSCVLDAGRVRR